ncbi:CDP-glycerol glycerophosphotransferase family protein [Flavobacteriales bacterium]|nr:CDP-glycerol glycerophosphotransferase family protein [Flavobacteriales bacterium]
MIKYALLYIISLLDFLVPKKKNYYLFSSAPDVSDNVLSFFRYLYLNGECDGKLIIWMLEDVNTKKYYHDLLANLLDRNSVDVQFVSRNSITGLYYYLRSRFVFFSHGIYKGVIIPSNHIVVNLWHGMPLKNFGYLDSNNQVSRSSLMTVTSKEYQQIFSDAFDIKKEDVVITGQPRCDDLLTTRFIIDKLPFLINKEKIIIWMPTYRKSIKGDIRVDGEDLNSLPALNWQEIQELDNYLSNHNYMLIIKLHLMDALNNHIFSKYKSIKIIKDSDISAANITLYELLSVTDLLLTDYSSVYIDYLLINKPFAFLMSDFESYLNTRGFVFNNARNRMPGQFILNYNELIKYFDNIFSGADDFKDQRKRENEKLNLFKDNFSKRLIDELRIRYNFGA